MMGVLLDQGSLTLIITFILLLCSLTYFVLVADLANCTGVNAGEHTLGTGVLPVGVLVKCFGISMAFGDEISGPLESVCIFTKTPSLFSGERFLAFLASYSFRNRKNS